MILHLIRHPKPLIEPGICYGQLDIPAESPEPLLENLRRQIPAHVPVWSSPLQRCRTLAAALHPAPQFDPRLMEMNFGEWEGLPWDDVPRHELEKWAGDVEHFAPPGGESALQVQQRVLSFFEKKYFDEVAIVTHAGVIRLLLSFHKKQSLMSHIERPIPYGSVTHVYCFCYI